MAVVPDPRFARLLSAMRALRDGDLEARAGVSGDDELAEIGALFDLLAARALTRQAERADGSTADFDSQSAANTGGRFETPLDRLEERERDVAVAAARVEQARVSLRERDQRFAQDSRIKAEFLANLSQELRTPLSSVLILAKLLAANAEGNLTPRQTDFARTIHGAAQDLLQLINDLLDLSKVESGRMELRAERVALAGLLADAEAAFRPQAEEKGLELVVQVDDGTPESIATDEHRLQQILRNLLSNAIKFTQHGSVTLEVSPDREVPGLLRFAVRDTGVGIAAERQQSVFEPFQRDAGFGGQWSVGSGLGLSISRELARLIGGNLTVRSALGQGSTFTLTLPITAEPEERAEAGSSAAARGERLAVPITPAADERDEDYGLGPQAPPPAVVLVVEPRRLQAMQHAAHSAVDGLGGLRGRVEVVTVRDGASREIEQLLTGRGVVAVLVNLTALQPEALFAAVAQYAPEVPVLAYEPGAGGSTTRMEFPADVALRVEFVGSRAQAVERLTLHLLTALPGSAAERSLAAEPGQPSPRFRAEKVLVVDDDMRNVFAMTSMLELHGLTVVHADNGRQGIETLLANPDIRLVLMDLMMPGMDGYMAIEYIRSLKQFADLPIIAVTAKAMRDDRQRSLAAGANEHVVKPVEVDVLLGLIGSMIGR